VSDAETGTGDGGRDAPTALKRVRMPQRAVIVGWNTYSTNHRLDLPTYVGLPALSLGQRQQVQVEEVEVVQGLSAMSAEASPGRVSKTEQ
jgi:hypothetical protein